MHHQCKMEAGLTSVEVSSLWRPAEIRSTALYYYWHCTKTEWIHPLLLLYIGLTCSTKQNATILQNIVECKWLPTIELLPNERSGCNEEKNYHFYSSPLNHIYNWLDLNRVHWFIFDCVSSAATMPCSGDYHWRGTDGWKQTDRRRIKGREGVESNLILGGGALDWEGQWFS